MSRFKVSPPLARRAKTIVIGRQSTDCGVLLGRLAEIGPQKEVALDLTTEHVVAVVGKRGSGKTYTLGVVTEGLASNAGPGVGYGNANSSHAILIFDTLNLFQWVNVPIDAAGGEQARRQLRDLRRWGLKSGPIEPMLWHPAGVDAGDDSLQFSIRPADMQAQDWARLLSVDLVTEPMGQLLSEAHHKVTRTGWSEGSTVHQARDDYSLEDLVFCIRTDNDIASDYAPETIRALRQRLSSFSRLPLFSPLGTDLHELLSPGRLTVMLLGRVPEDLRAVIVFMLVRRLLEERAAASEAQKAALIKGSVVPLELVPPTWLIIDEAQNVMPARSASASNDILTRFVREGRNHGLSMAISTQQPTAIDPRIMAQVDTLLAHTLTVRQDVHYILSNLKSSEPARIVSGSKPLTLAAAIRELELGQCLVSAVDSDRAFFLEVRPRVTMHGGFEQ